MIGPHNDRELELMLAGTKPLAAFSYDWRDGKFSAEAQDACIPDIAFKPYVESGQILRFERGRKDGDIHVKTVCFTLPSEGWRAEAYLWLRESVAGGRMPYDDAVDVIIGRLLGYSEEDIQSFLKQWVELSKK